eukprot:m51a1_g1691 putative desumoylating isopeptidase 1-like (467) ;mRNA; r:467109-468652
MAASEGVPVALHVYDISGGWASRLSMGVLGKQVDGIWHSGVVVYGREYFWGGDIQCLPAGRTPFGIPTRTLDVGRTFVPVELIRDFVDELRPRYTPMTYSLLSNNCNNFSSELVQFLTGSVLPEYIMNQAEELTSTPVGAMLRPAIEGLERQMREASGFAPAPVGVGADGQAQWGGGGAPLAAAAAAAASPASQSPRPASAQPARQIAPGAPALLSEQGSHRPFVAKIRSRVAEDASADVAALETALDGPREAGVDGRVFAFLVQGVLQQWPTGELGAPLFVLRSPLTRPGFVALCSRQPDALVAALWRALSAAERATRLLALSALSNLFATPEGEAIAVDSAGKLVPSIGEGLGAEDAPVREMAGAAAYNYARAGREMRAEDAEALAEALTRAVVLTPEQARPSETAEFRAVVALGHLATRSKGVATGAAANDSLQAVLVVLASAGEASTRVAQAASEVLSITAQ